MQKLCGIEHNHKGKERMGDDSSFWFPGMVLKMEATWMGEAGAGGTDVRR